MKKQLLMIEIILLLFVIGLSGCTNNTNEPSTANQEKILGQWIATIPNTPLIVRMNFVTNMSYYESINETLIWGTYRITEKTLTLEIGGVTQTFEYSFSNNATALTLFEIDDGEIYLIMIRE